MKRMTLALLLVWMAACSRVVVKLDDKLPDAAFTLDQDVAYREGWEWIQRGDPDRAIKLFQSSTAPLEKKHVGFAYALLAKGKIGQAREQFEKSLQLAPENLEAEIGLAQTFEFDDQRENAFHVYSRLLARYPENSKVKNKYVEIKSKATSEYRAEAEKEKSEGREDRYIRSLEQAAYFSPELMDIQIEIAEFYFQKNKWEKAQAHFLEIAAKDPRNAIVLMRLIDIYEKTEKYDRALLSIDQLLAIQPGDPSLEARKKKIREQFMLVNLPPKFKDIFFKKEVNREDLAALIGYYFHDYVKIGGAPVILTDIDSSFARDEIIRIASTGIIRERPNHTFDRFTLPDRAAFAVVLSTLIAFLEKEGVTLQFPPKESIEYPADISSQHKDFDTIAFLIQAQIVSLDKDKNFNPTLPLTPTEVVTALQKILSSVVH